MSHPKHGGDSYYPRVSIQIDQKSLQDLFPGQLVDPAANLKP